MRWLILITRWLCVPVAFVGALVLCGLAGVGVVRLLDSRCAVDAMVGGACVASWHTSGIEWVVYVGLFVSILGAVLLPARIAPLGKMITAAVCALVAAAVPLSIWLGLGWNDFRLISIEAVLVAALGVWWVNHTVKTGRGAP